MAETTPEQQAVINAAVELVEAQKNTVARCVWCMYPRSVRTDDATKALLAAVERMQAVRDA